MTDRSVRQGYGKSAERRTFSAGIEVRTAPNGTGGEKVLVSGFASTTEAPYEMYDAFGPYTEVVSRGAFVKTLSETPKVQLLVNHGGMSLAQTTSGSLRLSEVMDGDVTGLHMEADLNPARRDAGDLLTALRDGDIDEMSFAFRVTRQKWSPDYDERRIDEVNLNRGDVSVVNLGANPDTSVALRSQDVFAVIEHLEGDDLRQAHERLSARLGRSQTPAPSVPGYEIQRDLTVLRLH